MANESREDVIRQRPWLREAIEVLDHGIKHYRGESPLDLRQAMINVDNAVELAGRKYLLNETRLPNALDSEQLRKIDKKFAFMLKHLSRELKLNRATERNIGQFHDIRNHAYHNANGGVERKDVQAYISTAIRLLELMFGLRIDFAERMSDAQIAESIASTLQGISVELQRAIEQARQWLLLSTEIKNEYEAAVATRYRVAGYEVETSAQVRSVGRSCYHVQMLCKRENEVVIAGTMGIESLAELAEWPEQWLIDYRSGLEKALQQDSTHRNLRFRKHVITRLHPEAVEKLTRCGSEVEEWAETYQILCENAEEARAAKWKELLSKYVDIECSHRVYATLLGELHSLLDSYDDDETISDYFDYLRLKRRFFAVPQ